MTSRDTSTLFTGSFSRGLDLIVCGNRIGMVWIEWTYGIAEALVARIVEGESVVEETRTSIPDGRFPETVRACCVPDGRLDVLWTAFEDGRQRLFCTGPEGETAPVPVPAERRCASMAVIPGADPNTIWLALQTLEDAQPRMALWRREGAAWSATDMPVMQTGLPVDPALALLPDGGVILAWTAMLCRKSTIQAVTVGADGRVTLLEPLEQDGQWASHPALAVDGSGDAYLACCMETPIRTEGGDVNWHSRIVTATRCADDRAFEINSESPIDYAMNPWTAGYAGRRRKPSLVARPEGGGWVLFEEKNDPHAMSPGPGRLVLRALGACAETLLLSDLSEFHVASKTLPDGRLVVASLTQETRNNRCPPRYRLHQVDPGTSMGMRPADLPGNAGLPRFEVSLAADRPQDGDLRLFFGDPHVHSALSGDLEGDQDELYLFARDVAGLDFIALTENDFTGFTSPLPRAAWERSKRNAGYFNSPHEFTVFVGWEHTRHAIPWIPNSANAHRSVIYSGGAGPLHCWLDPDTDSAHKLAERLRGRRVLLHHHHPWGFDFSDNTLECNIEVCSGWFNCMRKPEFVARLHKALNRGFRLGFIGGSDNHQRNPGLGGALTGVWAEANTREAIFAAFEERRVFATTGLRPDLRFRVDHVPMGGAGQVSQTPTVHVRVRCDVPVQSITIIRDGDRVYEQSFTEERDVKLAWRDASAGIGPHWYYAHVRFKGDTPELPWNRAPAYGNDAWTSPVWIDSLEN